MADTNAESTSKLPKVMVGNSLQRSEQAVVPHSTPTANELSKKQLIVLMALFQNLLNNTYSPDVRELSLFATVKMVSRTGIMDEEEAETIARRLMSVRHGNIMDSMF